MTSSTDEKRAVFQVEFNLAGKDVRLELGVPTARTRLADLLPLFQGLANVFVDGAERHMKQEGLRVSCHAGCGACCRQIVPIGESEAIRLAELIDTMAPERRERVRERFIAAVAMLRDRGLLETLEDVAALDPDTRRSFGVEYFHCGVPCPFLEDESCSIHEDRPLGCREYLVTSPAENCSRPDPSVIDLVPLPLHVSRLLYRFEDGKGEDEPRWLPLVLALRWTEERRSRPEVTFSAPELFTRFLEKLAKAIETS